MIGHGHIGQVVFPPPFILLLLLRSPWDLEIYIKGRYEKPRSSVERLFLISYLSKEMGEGQWMSTGSYMISRYSANEGPVRIQYKCQVPIYVFPEMKLRPALFFSKTEF